MKITSNAAGGTDMTQKLQTTLSRRERQIMDILYRRGRATGIEVMEDLPGTPSYSTVRTQLRVLEKKGHVRHEEQGPKFIYLPAWRHPLDELARRETRILIELLRAEQQRLDGSRSLVPLRVKASRLLENLAKDGLIAAVEERIGNHLASLSGGVQRQWPWSWLATPHRHLSPLPDSAC